jgi:3-phenylpropionate/cinnamic acid dioxygenase small subunit
MRSNTQLLAQVIEFIGYEADLLDHKGYQEWLSLWTEEGLYIVPADLKATDYLNTLNLALDDADMRRMRVARLENGESVSALSVGDAVLMTSRVRLLEAGDVVVIGRCAMTRNELRHGRVVCYPGRVV